MSLKQVVPLKPDDLKILMDARKVVDDAGKQLVNVELSILKNYGLNNVENPWSCCIDGAFILVHCYDIEDLGVTE